MYKNKNIGGLLLFFLCFLPIKAKDWDWKKIDTSVNAVSFENKKSKDPFLFGVVTFSHGCEGEDGASVKPHNQWKKFEGKEIEIDGKKCKPLPHESGNACEHYKRYKEDIKLMKDLGFKAYRFSIAWGKVEPKEGTFDEKVLKHYENVCKELKKQGIKPIVTLYHYTHPCWFEDKDAFEKKENIKYFEKFCQKVFKHLKKYVDIWFVFNSFAGSAFTGYSEGLTPPFKKNMQLAVDVLKNILEAHVRVYHSLKKIDKSATVGLIKNMLHIDPYSTWNPLDKVASGYADTLANEVIYKFFKKGILKAWIPMRAKVKYKNKKAIGAFDCVGLNYYSGAYISNFKLHPRSELIATQDKICTIYPEGLYMALDQVWNKLAKEFEVPIYVTENGICTDNEEHRDIFYKRYLYALSEAVKDKIDVRGYFARSIMDGYEWVQGYTKNYGIYSVDRKTQKRVFRKGAQHLIDVVKNHGVGKKDATKITTAKINSAKQKAEKVAAAKPVISAEVTKSKVVKKVTPAVVAA